MFLQKEDKHQALLLAHLQDHTSDINIPRNQSGAPTRDESIANSIFILSSFYTDIKQRK